MRSTLLLSLGLVLGGSSIQACIGFETADGKGEIDSDALDSDDTDTVGDSDDSDPSGNQAPVASAGDDLESQVDRLVSLDGSASHDPDGDVITYAWEIVRCPSGASITLLNADRVSPQFVPDLPGEYEVELVVSDGRLLSTPDTVRIMAAPRGSTPVAQAGADQSVSVGATVGLDGSGSYDPDGDALAYAWEFVSVPSGSSAALSSATSPNPSFRADVAGTWEIRLVVSDAASSSDPDSVRVTASEGGGDSGCGCARDAEISLKRGPLGAWLLLPLLAGWRLRRKLDP